MNSVWQDLRYSVRTLIKRPGFTAVAVLTLALAIGANTTVFSVVNAVLLRPLAYKNSDRLAMIWESFPKEGWPYVPVSPPDYVDIKSQINSVEQMAAAYLDKEDFSLTGRGEPERVSGMPVSANLFSLLGAQPELGRDFLPEDEQKGHDGVVILSHRLWQRKFGADTNTIGQSVTIDGRPYSVVGVMPAGFQFPPPISSGLLSVSGDRDMWTPYVPGRPNRNNHPLAVIARLKPGSTLAQASAEVEAAARSLAEQYPETNAGIGAGVVSMKDMVVRNARPALWLLLGAAGLVLLIGCSNIANLLMVRAAGRRREMAVRAALGARRGRLARQVLTESLVLAACGGAGGLFLSIWGVEMLRSLSGATLPHVTEIGIDLKVMSFTGAVSVVTGLIFGLLPAVQSGRTNIAEQLKEGGRIPGGAGAARLRGLLVMGRWRLRWFC